MNTVAKRRWMLGAMFAVGFVTGAVCAAGAAFHFMPPLGIPSGADIIRHVSDDLRSEIKITPEQEQQIRPALERHGAELDAIRGETLMKVLVSIQAKNAAVEQVLTPEQRQKFKASESKRLQRFTDKEKNASPSSPAP